MFAGSIFRGNEEEERADRRFARTVALKFTVQLNKEAAGLLNVWETAVGKRNPVVEVG